MMEVTQVICVTCKTENLPCSLSKLSAGSLGPASVADGNRKMLGKISAQPHTIVKQICFPDGNVLFLLFFSLSKNWMHNVVWGCEEILPNALSSNK